MKILPIVSNKIQRKILNISLSVIRRHINKQEGLFIYSYERKTDLLTPLTWKARGVTSNDNKHNPTNSWDKLESIVDFSNKVVVDVGASLGATITPFSKVASIVYALEPHPDNYNFLLDQIKIRGLDNVKPHKLAVSDINGSTKFYNRESYGIHSLGVHNKGKIISSFNVDVVKLDDFWDKEINQQIGLLKIDVEGFETEVLNGAKNLLNQKKVDAVIFEFSPRIHKLRKIDIDSPIKILQDHGYQVLTTDGKPFTYNMIKTTKICDLIAIPN